MQDILFGLNKEQKDAVTTIDGPVLIIAGAGSGKTRALTHRIAYLIEQKISPQNILALTFTNKAANEMRLRISNLLGERFEKSYNSHITKSGGFMGTFHAFAVKILRNEITRLGRSRNFVIYDEKDTLSAVKDIMAELAIDSNQFRAGGIASAISTQKNELKDARTYNDSAKEFYEKLVGKVFAKYEEVLHESNALDFDDLLLLAVRVFKKFPDALEKYQDQFKYILVDEYQDTNHAQYTLLSMLAKKNKNLCVVGDDWQCFPPYTKIATSSGLKPIEKIKNGESVLSANGSGIISRNVIKTRKYDYKGKLIKITTSDGKSIETTPNHILFTKFSLKIDIYFVYLMYSIKHGYRIGIAKGARNSGKKIDIGLQVRANQERADKMWILCVVDSKPQAMIKEHLISIKYGLPTMVFSAYKNRSMKISQDLIDKLYKEIPTKEKVAILMKDFMINEDYPHFIPQGTTRKNSNIHKIRINLTLFGDPRKTNKSPWGLSRLTINTSHNVLKKILIQNGWKPRKGKKKDWRIEKTFLSYGHAESAAEEICGIAKKCGVPVVLVRSAKLGNEKKYFFQPSSHIRRGMLLPKLKNGRLENIDVKSVETIDYDGKIYDLDIQNTHNYIADGIVSHNSIYAFRGADFTNILRFEKDYPEAKIVFLEENYRSSQNILDSAHAVIEKNIYKTTKNLWTRRGKGDRVKIIETASESEEGYFITEEINNILRERKIAQDLNDFAILYRTNAQSRAIEEAIIQEGWPYKMVGALKFYDRREVKDIISYLRFIQNGKDLLSLKRIINTPPRGIGRASWDKISSASDLTKIYHPKVSAFLELVSEFKNILPEKKTSDFIKYIIEKINYKEYTLDGTDEGEARWENIQELITVASKFDSLNSQEGLPLFLEEIALASATDDISNERGELNLMTLHSAKGLEFPVVFIAGMEEGLIPHSKSAFDMTQMEEERRLCYVGLTRAKERSYMIFTRRRSLYGKNQPCIPSRFLGDIPAHLVEFKKYGEVGTEYLDI
jgi:DNA helicase-2/ATP-dependent DNA helicase PcrA